MNKLKEQEFLKVLHHFSREKYYRLLSGPINNFTDSFIYHKLTSIMVYKSLSHESVKTGILVYRSLSTQVWLTLNKPARSKFWTCKAKEQNINQMKDLLVRGHSRDQLDSLDAYYYPCLSPTIKCLLKRFTLRNHVK